MAKNFKLTPRTIISQLPKAGFTHLQFTCSGCGRLRRKALDELTWIQRMGSLEKMLPKVRCEICGEPPLPETFGAWSPTNFWKGPR